MPFTPSHAVVALPFVRTPLVPAAIAIGAMTPDLPLFLRGTPLTYGVTHSAAGIVVTMLVALVLFLLWHVLLRPAVREFVPAFVAKRLPSDWGTGGATALLTALDAGRPRGDSDDRRWRPRSALFLGLSLLIGVASHIVWDGFTHEERWGTAMFPALNEQWGPLLGVKWLQHGSSVLGLSVLGIAAIVWFLRTPPGVHRARRLSTVVRVLWWATLPILLVTAWVVGLAMHGPLDETFTVAHLAYRVLPPACAAWGALSVVVAIGLALPRRVQPGRFAR